MDRSCTRICRSVRIRPQLTDRQRHQPYKERHEVKLDHLQRKLAPKLLPTNCKRNELCHTCWCINRLWRSYHHCTMCCPRQLLCSDAFFVWNGSSDHSGAHHQGDGGNERYPSSSAHEIEQCRRTENCSCTGSRNGHGPTEVSVGAVDAFAHIIWPQPAIEPIRYWVRWIQSHRVLSDSHRVIHDVRSIATESQAIEAECTNSNSGSSCQSPFSNRKCWNPNTKLP